MNRSRTLRIAPTFALLLVLLGTGGFSFRADAQRIQDGWHSRGTLKVDRRPSESLPSTDLGVAEAEVSTPADPVTGLTLADPIEQLLREGASLESGKRWAEALVHYEDALRQFPDEIRLRDRASVARIHYDLARRYADSSFQRLARDMDRQDALGLFDEVMLKIQTHYVHEPDWDGLLKQGTNGLEIALHDDRFVSSHQVRSGTEQIDSLIAYVRRVLAERHLRDRGQALAMVRWIGDLAEYRLHISAAAVVVEYVCVAANSLDHYSAFLTGNQLDEVYSQIEGNFVGLGVELKGDERTRSLLIVDVIAGGPAEQAGIVPGDRITAVNATRTATLSTDAAADLLKGDEGSHVDVTVQDKQGHSRLVTVTRRRVEVPSVERVQMLDAADKVGYFRISSFQKTTSRDVDGALWKLHRQGMRSLVIDVRGNPGGLLTEAVEVADRFVFAGTIVATHGRNVRENYDYQAHRVGTWQVPLVVLIDEDSASAAEIFAGAIRDHQRGTVVGHRSYGKGSVQGIFPLRSINAGLRLTTAKFFAPSGRAISNAGVEPDVIVRQTSRPIDGELAVLRRADMTRDPVLRAAVRLAREARVAPAPLEETQQLTLGSAAAAR